LPKPETTPPVTKIYLTIKPPSYKRKESSFENPRLSLIVS
jgi:hypothetical protein